MENRQDLSSRSWLRRLLDKAIARVWLRIAAALAVAYFSRKHLLNVFDWEAIRGYEAYWIARAVSIGEGYSFSGANRWLFDDLADGSYHPTAWMDPLYTYILSGFIWLFGDTHQFAAALFNFLLYVAVLGLLYCLVRRLSSEKAGLLATVLLAFSLSSSNSAMNNTYLAATFILLSAIALTAFFSYASIRRSFMLGGILGCTALTCASAQLFIPITAAAIVFWGRARYKLALTHAAAVLVAASTVMAPWMIRNYVVFDELITVRNGAGQIMFVGVVAAAGTVRPELLASSQKPDWRASTLRRAVYEADDERLIALEDWQRTYAEEVGPQNWAGMNEAQRDDWFLQETKRFMLDNPAVSLELAAAKLEVFVRTMGWTGLGVIFVAGLGALTTLRSPVGSTIALWVGSYVAPFLLVICYYDRYRLPIEPLLIVLAIFAAFRGSRGLWSNRPKGSTGFQ